MYEYEYITGSDLGFQNHEYQILDSGGGSELQSPPGNGRVQKPPQEREHRGRSQLELHLTR
jgi:hypothetical protein